MSVLFILVFAFMAGPATPPDPQLIGTWAYDECHIKNTRVQGTLEFTAAGAMVLKATARDDCPTPKISGHYSYTALQGQLQTNYTGGYGVEKYYLVEGETMYLAPGPISHAQAQWKDGYLATNYHYKLIRKKK